MTVLATDPSLSTVGLTVRRFTVADLALLPSELPSGPVRYELHHGVLIPMAPPGYVHGIVESKFVAYLFLQGELKGHGQASSGEVGIVLARDPDHVFGADAAFIVSARLPARRSPEGYLETIPDLVVEVRSKNDSVAELARKAGEYLAAGARVTWVADPLDRNVIEFRPGLEPRVYTEDDVLTVEDVIPGFQLPVRLALQETP